jgi:hypothetical protein
MYSNSFAAPQIIANSPQIAKICHNLPHFAAICRNSLQFAKKKMRHRTFAPFYCRLKIIVEPKGGAAISHGPLSPQKTTFSSFFLRVMGWRDFLPPVLDMDTTSEFTYGNDSTGELEAGC